MSVNLAGWTRFAGKKCRQMSSSLAPSFKFGDTWYGKVAIFKLGNVNICHQIPIPQLNFLTALHTRQDGLENRD